jgi:uncharacterized protein YlxW (UPF0749 family)
MSEDQKETGTGWPEPTGPSRPSGPAGEPDPRPDAPPADGVGPAVEDPAVRDAPPADDPADDASAADAVAAAEPGEAKVTVSPSALGLTSLRLTGAGAIIGVLLALLGFTLVVQLKNTSSDPTLAATRQEDLVRILSDLEAQKDRLRQEIAGLEESQRQLTSGAAGRQAALDEATRRADELGILAGTLPARGPGLAVRFSAAAKPISASTLLDAVQELRGAGAEAMQISGSDGTPVRVIASTYFLDGADGVTVDGRRLTGPYTITVIGEPTTMRTALNIPGGVVASVNGDGGNVIVQERAVAEVSALSEPRGLKYARPVA